VSLGLLDVLYSRVTWLFSLPEQSILRAYYSAILSEKCSLKQKYRNSFAAHCTCWHKNSNNSTRYDGPGLIRTGPGRAGTACLRQPKTRVESFPPRGRCNATPEMFRPENKRAFPLRSLHLRHVSLYHLNIRSEWREFSHVRSPSKRFMYTRGHLTVSQTHSTRLGRSFVGWSVEKQPLLSASASSGIGRPPATRNTYSLGQRGGAWCRGPTRSRRYKRVSGRGRSHFMWKVKCPYDFSRPFFFAVSLRRSTWFAALLEGEDIFSGVILAFISLCKSVTILLFSPSVNLLLSENAIRPVACQ